MMNRTAFPAKALCVHWRNFICLASTYAFALLASPSQIHAQITAPAKRSPGNTIVAAQSAQAPFVSDHALSSGSFPIANDSGAASIVVDTADFWIVQRAAQWLGGDIEKVSGHHSELINVLPAKTHTLIIIGSLEHSSLIRNLAVQGKINTASMDGKWECYSYQVVQHPFHGVDQALVIAGSDKRGTAYGALDLSRQIGVSPWYWWADVPPQLKKGAYLNGAPYFSGSPGVKYRGIFINDEAPAFSGWAREKFGGVNHLVYEKIFELLLRLKANYLWPAMWGNAFNDDDTLNPVLADRYGIVMGTSHHEPMLRAQQEWKRFGSGDWNYETNGEFLREFWKKGIEHMDHHESIVTVGMRGDGDKPMTEGSNIALLEKIVADQRKIIGDVTGKKPEDIPQDWALYKEVQDYYDKGMQVPDDVTLLLCDDNWGNIRKLPKPGSPPRKGGYGIYYHFDYVGGPRNYKWLNTNSIARTWEQLHLAYENEVRQIWVVNVGDLKPMEFPISFFLDYAWNPDQYDANDVRAYASNWARQQFGPQHATAIGYMLREYTFLNSRRKPELLSPDTYSLVNYREWERVRTRYDQLRAKAEALYSTLPREQRDAFFELILFPIQACANLGDLHFSAASNHLFTAQGRAEANAMADSVQAQFKRDSLLCYSYNHDLAGGKWAHMMDQTHIGYTYWQEPRRNSMPKIARLELPSGAEMGVALEGTDSWWGAGSPAHITDSLGGAPVFNVPRRVGDPPASEGPKGQTIPAGQAPSASEARLPAFNVYLPQRHYIDLFKRGETQFDYSITKTAPWISVSSTKGTIYSGDRIWVTVIGNQVPEGRSEGAITITPFVGEPVTVHISVQGRLAKEVPRGGFVENEGCVSMDAAHYSTSGNVDSTRWVTIAEVGKTGAGVTFFPVTTPSMEPGTQSPFLDYAFYLFDTGNATVQLYCSPTLSYYGNGGRRMAVSIDDGAPQILALPSRQEGPVWDKMVADNICIVSTSVHFSAPGAHTLRYWMVDPGVVLQKLVIDLGGVRPSYLGPPETPMQPGLKDYFRDNFPVGVSVMARNLSGQDSVLILQQFNSLTPENEMKMRPIHPEPQRYDFRKSDSIVDWAQAHHILVRGHNLCWHENTPAWLFKDSTGGEVTKDVLLQRLQDHIRTIVSRYKGKVYAWDVVNEAVSDDPSELLRNSPWYRICGEDFLKVAFQTAHQADPDAQLFYNDYNTERAEKRERVYRLLKELLDAGVPVTGIGLQGHWSTYEPSASDLTAAIERFSALGLKVQITELDVSIYPWEKQVRPKRPSDDDSYSPLARQRQTEQYKMVFGIFRQFSEVINGVTFWNITDRHTWLDQYPVPGRKNYPLLFDTDGEPKDAFWEVVGDVQ